jgi:hypothetical protein
MIICSQNIEMKTRLPFNEKLRILLTGKNAIILPPNFEPSAPDAIELKVTEVNKNAKLGTWFSPSTKVFI